MEQYFLSKNNLASIYNILAEKLLRTYNYDITNEINSGSDLQKIMILVFKNINKLNLSNKNLEECKITLNKQVINIYIQNFLKRQKEDRFKSVKTNSLNIDKRDNIFKNKISDYPQTSNLPEIEEQNINNNFERMKAARIKEVKDELSRPEINFSENIFISNQDVEKKFKQLDNLRNEDISDKPKSVSFNDIIETNELQNSFQNQFNLNNSNNNTENEFSKQFETQNINIKFNQLNIDDQVNDSEIKDNKLDFTNNNNNMNDTNQLDVINQVDIINNQFNQNNIENFSNKNTKIKRNQIKTSNKKSSNSVELHKYFDNELNNNYQSNNNNNQLNISQINDNQSNNKQLNNNQNIFQDNLKIEDNVLNNNQFFGTLNKVDILKEENYEYTTHNLLINSIDRKWYNDFDIDGNVIKNGYHKRYQYSINFEPESDSTFKIPVYENNEFIALNIDNPKHKQQILRGIKSKNINGFTFNNRTYPAYIPSNPKGEILDYEYGIMKGENDSINIHKQFKNVVSIKLKRIILPNIDEYLYNNETDQIYVGCKIEPYMLVAFDEFGSNIITTNSKINKVFSKVIYDREYSSVDIDIADNTNEVTQSRGYIHLLDEDDYYKLFYPSPLSELNKLTFSLLRPDGRLYSDIMDNLEVTQIIKGTDKGFFTLVLNKPVHRYYFKQSDRIIVKNLRDSSGQNSPDLPSNLITYLEEGAYIYKKYVPTESSDQSIDRIYVSYNVTDYYSGSGTGPNDAGNQDTGLYQATDYYYNQYESWSSGNQNIKGFIINVSHQHTLILEVKTKNIFNNGPTPEII